MPNRIVRESILTSESVCSLAWPEEVFYRRLMSVVDDFGRYEASAKLLRSKCYPLQVDSVREADISRWLAACQKVGLILLYAVDGKQYIEMSKFGQQQRTKSKFPDPVENHVDSKCYQVPANEHLGVVVGVVVSEGVDAKEQMRSRGSRLPDDFPSPTELRWAMQERQGIDAAAESMKFRDYWIAQPGSKGRKSDWPATWRNWIRNARAPTHAWPAGNATPSKNAQAIHALEGLKSENRRLDCGATATLALPEPGKPAGS